MKYYGSTYTALSWTWPTQASDSDVQQDAHLPEHDAGFLPNGDDVEALVRAKLVLWVN